MFRARLGPEHRSPSVRDLNVHALLFTSPHSFVGDIWAGYVETISTNSRGVRGRNCQLPSEDG